jgi:hypothetical protein
MEYIAQDAQRAGQQGRFLLVSSPGSIVIDHECQMPFHGCVAGPHRGTYRRI